MMCFSGSSSKSKDVKKPREYTNPDVKNVQFAHNERKPDKAALSKGRLTKEKPLKMKRSSKKGKKAEKEVNIAEMSVGDIV